MSLFFRKRKQPDTIVFLECWNYFGCVYRVIGHDCNTAAHYHVEIEREPGNFKMVLRDFASLNAALTLALFLLDNGALPGDMQAFSSPLSEDAVYIKRG